jgi:hypothetical protein
MITPVAWWHGGTVDTSKNSSLGATSKADDKGATGAPSIHGNVGAVSASVPKIALPDALETHKLAFNISIDRIVGFVGNYYVKLGGKVDALLLQLASANGARESLLPRLQHRRRQKQQRHKGRRRH